MGYTEPSLACPSVCNEHVPTPKGKMCSALRSNAQLNRIGTAAEYPIRQAAVAVSISGLEELQNSGEEAIIDLLESRIMNAEDTFMNG
jgi:hypothetical protein